MTYSEIGSHFWLTPEETSYKDDFLDFSKFGFGGLDHATCSSGRSAISLVIQNIIENNKNLNKIVCLPSYTCDTVIEPFLKWGFTITTYPIDTNLTANPSEILNIIKKSKASVFLFHHLFGFETIPQIDSILHELNQIRVITIEDVTQSLYSDVTRGESDYIVASLRKWCGIFDGACVISKRGPIKNKPTIVDSELIATKSLASNLKYNYITFGAGNKSIFLDKYKKSEEIIDNQNIIYRMSPQSIGVQNNIDILSLKKKRKKNYEILSKIKNSKYNISVIFKNLTDNITPLYMPIICKNRAAIQKQLISNNIYAPIIWPMPLNLNKDQLFPETLFLYNHLLCIPIDQRYSENDMNRIIEVLL